MKEITEKDIKEGKELFKILNSLNPINRIMAITYIDALGDQQRAHEMNEKEDIVAPECEVIK